MKQEEYNQFKSEFLQLEISDNGKTEKIWTQQLKNILYSDIHQKPLGCKISNTHIKVGNVHLEDFYEAEVLFSHHYWINIFSDWLFNMIFKILPSTTKEVFVIGYETYIEPVVFLLQQKFRNKNIELFYGIYEEPKYTQNKGYSKTKTNIRYIDNFKKRIKNSTPIYFLCGISTTLNTYREMEKKLLDEIPGLVHFYHYTLIQVLPTDESSLSTTESYGEIPSSSISYCGYNTNENLILRRAFRIDNSNSFCLEIYNDDKYVLSQKQQENPIIARYLIAVKSKWHSAYNCPLCKPGENERPLIRTSETSVVPAQMIKASWFLENRSSSPKTTSKINLFQRTNSGFLFSDYLYYGHVDRMDHHYIYYIRSNHLIKSILDNKYPSVKMKFEKICKEIQNKLFPTKDSKFVDIIVFPSESGDEIFPSAINQFVFNNSAHTISVDPNKEFRSNFVTKHSNIAYFLEQTSNNRSCKIRFHYVAKHLVASETFSRIQSLVRSLMETHLDESDTESDLDNNSNKKTNIKPVFDDVIIFMSRNSNSAKLNYVSNINNYFSFVDIDIPSIRYYGDACPMCKLEQEVKDYKNSSMLHINTKHWSNKDKQYTVQSIEEKKIDYAKKSLSLKRRYFRRFFLENSLYKATKLCASEEQYYQAMIDTLLSLYPKPDMEVLISFIKVISSPYLYYHENEKKAALKLVSHIAKQFIIYNGYISIKISPDQSMQIKENSCETAYSLLVVCLNCLSKMDSAFILSTETIKKLCDTVRNMKIEDSNSTPVYPLKFGEILLYDTKSKEEYKLPGFYSCIANNCKRIICGIGKEERSYSFESQLSKDIIQTNDKTNKILQLERLLYLENSSLSNSICKDDLSTDVIIRYEAANANEPSIKKSEREYSTSILGQIGHDLSITDTDVHFIYYEFKHVSSSDSKDIIFSFGSCEKPGNIRDLIKECLESDERIIFDDKTCLVYLASSEDTNIGMLLYLSFSKFDANSIEGLKRIRYYLSYSQSVISVIENDISNNSIHSAIQSREAHNLMLSGKIVSHGGFSETLELSQTSAYLIKCWKSISEEENSDEKNEFFKYACQSINALMERCIGFGSIKNFVEHFANPSKDSGFDTKESSPLDALFDNYCLFINNNIRGLFAKTKLSTNSINMEFLQEYLYNIIKEDSCYWSHVSEIKKHSKFDVNLHLVEEKGCTKGDTSLTKEKLVPLIIQKISQVNVLPSFLNSASFDKQFPSIFLVGIIDTLLRNAYDHTEAQSTSLDIIFSYNDDSYSFKIINDADADMKTKQGRGQTQRFFEVLNRISHDKGGHFQVELGEIDEINKKHVARLNVKGGPISENCQSDFCR